MRVKIILFFLFLFLLSSVQARELRVVDNHHQVKLKYNQERIVLLSYYVDLSLIKKKCNAEIILSFKDRTNKILYGSPFIKVKIKNGFEYYLDGIKYSESYKSVRGKFLLGIIDEIHRMKFEEKFLCEKKGA